MDSARAKAMLHCSLSCWLRKFVACSFARKTLGSVSDCRSSPGRKGVGDGFEGGAGVRSLCELCARYFHGVSCRSPLPRLKPSLLLLSFCVGAVICHLLLCGDLSVGSSMIMGSPSSLSASSFDGSSISLCPPEPVLGSSTRLASS